MLKLKRRSLKLHLHFFCRAARHVALGNVPFYQETLSRTKHSCRVPAQLDTQSLGIFEGKIKKNNSDDVSIFYRTIPKVSDLLTSEYF